jgi:hypothetical protein
MATLLSIIEVGGYPDFTSLYQSLGYHTEQVQSVRKALSLMKRTIPSVMVAEFNFQSDFRDRTSSLETLLATRQQRWPDCQVIVLYEKEYEHAFARLQSSYHIDAALAFPVNEHNMRNTLERLQATASAS